jgi:hypothetical protein
VADALVPGRLRVLTLSLGDVRPIEDGSLYGSTFAVNVAAQ